jgi:hypothetical protein
MRYRAKVAVRAPAELAVLALAEWAAQVQQVAQEQLAALALAEPVAQEKLAEAIAADNPKTAW